MASKIDSSYVFLFQSFFFLFAISKETSHSWLTTCIFLTIKPRNILHSRPVVFLLRSECFFRVLLALEWKYRNTKSILWYCYGTVIKVLPSRFNCSVLLVVINCCTIMVQVNGIKPILEDRSIPNSFSSNIEVTIYHEPISIIFEPK